MHQALAERGAQEAVVRREEIGKETRPYEASEGVGPPVTRGVRLLSEGEGEGAGGLGEELFAGGVPRGA